MRCNRFPVVLAVAGLAMAFVLTATPADAAVIVTPTGATSTTWIGSGDRTIAHTIDGTGLSAGGTSGDVLSETHTPNNANTGTYWLSANGAPSGGEVLEFAIPKSDIDAIHQWVYTRNGETDRGLRTFDLSFSTDNGGTFPTTISAATLGDFTGPPPVATLLPQTKTFALQTGVTDVRLSNLVNFGDPNYMGLSEIRFGGPSGPPPVEQTIGVNADAYVQGLSPDSGTNFGSSTVLRIKRNQNDTYNRKTYMRFDLDDLVGFAAADLTDASLLLNFIDSGAGSDDGSTVYEFELYGLNDGDAGEGWAELGINWNNAPANDTSSRFELLSNATSLGTFELTGKGIGLLDVSSPELLSFLQSSTADDLVTFIITRNTPGTPQVTYVHAIGSKENGSVVGPQLVLTGPAAVVPEPSTFALAALGLLGLGIFGRRRRKRVA